MTKPRNFRFVLTAGAFCLFAAYLLLRYAGLAALRDQPLPAGPPLVERGPILDRDGRVLALESALFNVAVWRPETRADSFPQDAKRLAALLGLPSEQILRSWSEGQSDFFYLKKRVSPQVARGLQEAKAEGSFPGLVVERVAGRLYPEKNLASHLVGFVGDGNRGRAGIENKYEEDLQPRFPAGSAPPGESLRGNQVVLTIDADLQHLLEGIGRRAMEETGSESLMLLAGDARNGEILAYVALPDFDPNEYYRYPQSSWYDWPAIYAYEPGSVFKVFSMASVLDLGVMGENTSFLCDGSYRRTAPSGEVITIKCLGVHGQVGIEEILEYSCNAGAAYAADRSQSLDFYERLRSFGFGGRTGVALPGESPGSLRSPEGWSLRSKPTIAMGQEVLVTAVQMLSAATAVANGGVLLKPLSVKRVLGPEGALVYENEAQPVGRVVSEETARAILLAMEAAAGEGGTGRRAKVRDLPMAVKTGTAQMIDPATRRYSETDYIASTVAILPVEEPRLVLYLAIVKPKGESYYGGRVAAPIVKEAAEAYLSIADLPRGESPRVLHSGAVSLPRSAPYEIGSRMPDLQGAPKRLLLGLLERRDLSVRMEGEGWVVEQEPAPGAIVGPGTEIRLVFR